MKKILSLLIILSTIFYTHAQSNIITNKSLLDMVDLGFSEEIIITKIQTSETNFDTGIEALKELKNKGISDNIIIEIMNTTKEDIITGKEIESKSPGIYYTKNHELYKILPTVFTGTKTNTLGSALSYGIASSKIKSVMNKSQSSNVINSSQPEFWFFFNPNSEINLGATNWWFTTATSPNEFALAKLDVKKNRRELVTGSVNIYSGANIGVSEKHAIQFNIEIIDDYTFVVTIPEPLNDGEYCFFYQGVIPQGGTYANQSVFDFSIRATE